MEQTVISIFSDDTNAKSAVKRLVNSGFARGSIDCFIRNEFHFLYPGEPFRFERYFQPLLEDQSEAELYSIIASCETAVIAVRTAGQPESQRVADILTECGAIDIYAWVRRHPLKFLYATYLPESETNKTSLIVDRVAGVRSRLLEERVSYIHEEDNAEAARKDLDSLLSTI